MNASVHAIAAMTELCILKNNHLNIPQFLKPHGYGLKNSYQILVALLKIHSCPHDNKRFITLMRALFVNHCLPLNS